MKKRSIFTTLVAVSAALLVLFSACGTAGGGTAAAGDAGGGGAAATGEAAAATDSEETMTIRIAALTGHTEPNSWMQQQIEERYNVIIDLIPLPGWADGQARINLLMADEANRPDVIWWWGMDREFTQWVDAGLLVDKTDFFHQFPNINNYYTEMNLFMAASEGGRMFRVPGDIAEPACMTTWIRQDWLDNLGLDIPTNLHQFVHVLEQFTHSDPTGTGEQTFGFSGQGLEFRSFHPFWSPWNLHPGHFVVLEDGRVIHGSTEPEMRYALSYIHNLAVQGAIDPILAVSHPSPGEIFINGGHGAFYRWVAWLNPGGGDRIAFETHNPGAVITPLEPIQHPQTGFSTDEPENPGAWCWWAITTSAQDPERIFAMFDDMASPENFIFRMWGEEGVHYEFDADGVFMPLVSQEDNMAQNIGLGFLSNFVSRKDEANITNTRETIDLFQRREVTARAAADKRIYWRAVERPLWFMHGADLETARDEIFFGIMMGQRPVEDFDVWVDMYYNVFNGEALNAEAQALWDEHIADYHMFAESWNR